MAYRTIAEFLEDWRVEADDTALVLGALTDESLDQAVLPGDPGHRTLGRMAWHLVTTVPEMMSKTGLAVPGVDPESSPPTSAEELLETYEAVAAALADAVEAAWEDADLSVEDEMYGDRWVRGFTAKCLVHHQIHHRGQMTVLMRQAGLEVPGVYGPAYEGWALVGMPPPAV